MLERKCLPDVTILRRVFSYDPVTGALIWRDKIATRSQVVLGAVAGHIRDGRCSIKIRDTPYLRSRLVWKFVHGVDPGPLLDHVDRDTTNDRVENLREITFAENALNSVRRTSRTGLRGAYHAHESCAFYSQIISSGICEYLGAYPTALQAHEAYCKRGAEIYGDKFFSGRVV